MLSGGEEAEGKSKTGRGGTGVVKSSIEEVEERINNGEAVKK